MQDLPSAASAVSISLLITAVRHFSTSQVRSTDTDRTIASALSLAYGLYPPVSSNETAAALAEGDLPLGFIVVPVHTTAAVNDVSTLAYDKCPRYHAALQRLYASAAFLDYEQQQADFFSELLVSVPTCLIWSCLVAFSCLQRRMHAGLPCANGVCYESFRYSIDRFACAVCL
jgi:hypothetical protein